MQEKVELKEENFTIIVQYGYIRLPEVKTSFNYCSSGGGQNSVIPVVVYVPE